MSITLEHTEAKLQIEDLPNGRKKVLVEPLNPSQFISRFSCETSYSEELIRLILKVKGPFSLCDEIARDEDELYVKSWLKKAILAYVDESQFINKRILDFGCGSGASTINIAKMFPNSEIVGVELNSQLLEIANSRKKHYSYEQITFVESPSNLQLPSEIGCFDFVILNAVYEHLFPDEREQLIPQIWSIIKPNGILFLNETPYRYWPLEVHTTGLPLINYLPDAMTLKIARRFSKRVNEDISWETLLRQGIRGATEEEILKIIRKSSQNQPILLEPKRLGCQDRVDLFYLLLSNKYKGVKQALKLLMKGIKLVSGVTFVPVLSLALQKSETN